MIFDTLLLARLQFAFTISFHIIFPSITIGLSFWLVIIEFLSLKTRKQVYINIYKMWIKIFSICFTIGVLSGIVMSYQIGTNWSLFSLKISNILGPLFSLEVLTAFFLEASFLGIMLFGWNKVSPRMHFFATCMVALGTSISAFWILSANSWMQTPDGFSIRQDGMFYPVNWYKIIFNPSFLVRYFHTMIASHFTVSFIILGVASYYIVKQKFLNEAKILFRTAGIIAVLSSILQPIVGDMHGLNTLKHQPLKISAMEAIWNTESPAAFRVFAIPNAKQEKNDFEFKIPYLSSLILTHSVNGKILGLKEWNKDDRPNVTLVFFAFRIMVGIGLAMLMTTIISVILYFKNRLFNKNLIHYWYILMSPCGLIALLSGWIVTEVGRQPFTVYKLLRTKDSVSVIDNMKVFHSLMGFVVVYSILFIIAIYYIFSVIKKGPVNIDNK